VHGKREGWRGRDTPQTTHVLTYCLRPGGALIPLSLSYTCEINEDWPCEETAIVEALRAMEKKI